MSYEIFRVECGGMDGADDDANVRVELTERGEYVLPRAIELNDAMPDLPFWECLDMAQREYDSGIQ